MQVPTQVDFLAKLDFFHRVYSTKRSPLPLNQENSIFVKLNDGYHKVIHKKEPELEEPVIKTPSKFKNNIYLSVVEK